MSAKKISRTAGASKRVVLERDTTDNLCPLWCFDRIDRNGEFAFDLRRPDLSAGEVVTMFEKVIHYSGMTWSDIKRQTHDKGKSKHHFLEYDGLSNAARERVERLNMQDETDAIFSFAFDNTMRIIGIRDGERFHAVWIDPYHKFCPSHKKHT